MSLYVVELDNNDDCPSINFNVFEDAWALVKKYLEEGYAEENIRLYERISIKDAWTIYD